MRLRALPVVCALLLPSAARASGSFPAVVERAVPGAKVTCATCHRSLDAGADLTSFGAALKARGAVGKDDASLEAALARMKADSVDSDGDGARDLDELAWGGDPNEPDLPPLVPEEPTYGWCAQGRGRATGPWLLLGLVAVLRGVRGPAPARRLGARALTR